MRRLWFITNPASGTATPAKCEALAAVFAERGLELAGRTGFPAEALPTPEKLDGERVDTVVLFAGDGTINAALCALADWDGAFLILPGGTMNLLAKALHGNLEPAAIVHLAHERARRVALPFAEAGPHRAFVGLILGPAAHWFRAREMVRKGRLGRLVRAARHAWRRTFSGGVRLRGAKGLRHAYQAVLVTPRHGYLEVAGVDAPDWRSIAELGWDWMTGDWMAARAVTDARAQTLTLAERRPVLALFDGEPVQLEPGVPITGGRTEPRFLTTLPEEDE